MSDLISLATGTGVDAVADLADAATDIARALQTIPGEHVTAVTLDVPGFDLIRIPLSVETAGYFASALRCVAQTVDVETEYRESYTPEPTATVAPIVTRPRFTVLAGGAA